MYISIRVERHYYPSQLIIGNRTSHKFKDCEHEIRLMKLMKKEMQIWTLKWKENSILDHITCNHSDRYNQNKGHF